MSTMLLIFVQFEEKTRLVQSEPFVCAPANSSQTLSWAVEIRRDDALKVMQVYTVTRELHVRACLTSL